MVRVTSRTRPLPTAMPSARPSTLPTSASSRLSARTCPKQRAARHADQAQRPEHLGRRRSTEKVIVL